MSSRIKGPSDKPPAPVDAASAVGQPLDPSEPAAVAKTGSASFAPAAAVDPVTEIAGRLKAGEIDVDQAVGLLIDDAVERQIGRATLSPDLGPKLRELLRGYAASDPHLAAKIRRLTRTRE